MNINNLRALWGDHKIQGFGSRLAGSCICDVGAVEGGGTGGKKTLLWVEVVGSKTNQHLYIIRVFLPLIVHKSG